MIDRDLVGEDSITVTVATTGDKDNSRADEAAIQVAEVEGMEGEMVELGHQRKSSCP